MQKKIITLLSCHEANIKKNKMTHIPSHAQPAQTYTHDYLYGFDSLAKCCYFIMWFNYLRILFKVFVYSFIIEPQKSVLGSKLIKLHACKCCLSLNLTLYEYISSKTALQQR